MGLVFLKTEGPWMLRMTIELLSKISLSTLLGSPISWMISFLTITLACDWFTGTKRVVVSSLWRDLTMYFVLIEADIVGFDIVLRL